MAAVLGCPFTRPQLGYRQATLAMLPASRSAMRRLSRGQPFLRPLPLGSRRPFTVARQAVSTVQEAESAAASDVDTGLKQSTAYPFPAIEKKWQEYWETNKTFRTPLDVDYSKPKYYVLDMFPYPRYSPHMPHSELPPASCGPRCTHSPTWHAAASSQQQRT
jgi:hypothetical protein